RRRQTRGLRAAGGPQEGRRRQERRGPRQSGGPESRSAESRGLMRPTSNRRRRQQARRGDSGGEEGGGGSERWLLTYADMITLLLALFVVLFSISAVNVSKFKTLKQTLEQAFSPHILSGGGSIIPNGASKAAEHKAEAAIAALAAKQTSASTMQAEEEQFRRLKEKLDA